MLRNIIFAALAVALISTFSCSDKDSGQERTMGSVKMALSLPDGSNINTVHWHITGNGVDMQGDIQVPDPMATISALISGIPAGQGYLIELTAEADDGAQCSAEATFDVTASLTTQVSLTLQCVEVEVNGSLEINVDANICPTVDYMTVMPLVQAVGQQIALNSQSSDNDGDTVISTWSSLPAGNTFDDPAATSTMYNCVLAGSFTITLTVFDGQCDASMSVEVECVSSAVCGNGGQPEPGEQCDDGNQVSEDGCSYPDCRIEYCGDQVVQAGLGEQCDDGNSDPLDGCDNCILTGCGNGVLEPQLGEECDDSNTQPCDGCSGSCTNEVCGNGTTDCNEECDDGNQTPGDGCENDCTLSPTCDDCESVACTNYQNIDVYNACYNDPANGDLCLDWVMCARENECAFNHPNECYCGTASQADCMGGSANGPCIAEVEAAAGSTSPMTIGQRFMDAEYALGDGTMLLLCDRENCNPICLQDPTP